MRLRTASEVIAFVKKIEGESAAFYDTLAHRFTLGGDTFRSFAAQNRRTATEIERAYYSVITDAIEGGFAFNIDADQYPSPPGLPEAAPLADAVREAIAVEDRILTLYAEAVGQSKSLMADIPRAFEIAARKRKDRRQKLDLLAGAGP
jgi:hypothetical protein